LLFTTLDEIGRLAAADGLTGSQAIVVPAWKTGFHSVCCDSTAACHPRNGARRHVAAASRVPATVMATPGTVDAHEGALRGPTARGRPWWSRQAVAVAARAASHASRASGVVGSKSGLIRIWIFWRSSHSW
jgi:hypothetical protein